MSSYIIGGLGIALLLAGLIESAWRKRRNERCPTCGYVKRGPMHDEEKCEAMRDVRELTEDDIKKRKLFRKNRDKLGF